MSNYTFTVDLPLPTSPPAHGRISPRVLLRGSRDPSRFKRQPPAPLTAPPPHLQISGLVQAPREPWLVQAGDRSTSRSRGEPGVGCGGVGVGGSVCSTRSPDVTGAARTSQGGVGLQAGWAVQPAARAHAPAAGDCSRGRAKAACGALSRPPGTHAGRALATLRSGDASAACSMKGLRAASQPWVRADAEDAAVGFQLSD